MSGRVEQIGDATLILGDCREVLPTLERAGAIITDPPYGLGDRWQGGKREWPLHHQDGMAWDADTHTLVVRLPELADQCIIWGGHLYPLPPARGWLVWDKLIRKFTSGHCEVAWTNLDQPIKAFNYSNGQLATEGKFHPTQKPVPLMQWCVCFSAGTVLDPFMGSGSTGVACAKMGRPFVGIELDARHFDTACRRVSDAYSQGDMFLEGSAA